MKDAIRAVAMTGLLFGVVTAAPRAGAVDRIGGRVWGDYDADSLQTEPDLPVPGVIVRLLNASGSTLATTVTNDLGEYSFTQLTAGQSYSVQVVRPRPEMLAVTKDVGSDDSVDSDVDPTTLTTDVFQLVDAEDATRWDAGFRTHPIGGRVWEDTDGDGLQEPAEPGLAGIQVELRRGLVSELTMTGSNGEYAFPRRVADSTYTLGMAHPGFVRTLRDRGDDLRDSDFPASGTLTITLGQPGSVDIWDLGLLRGGTVVGDRVWADVNGNGRQETGEPGIPGVRIRALDEQGSVVGESTSDGFGRYVIGGLVAGTQYRLQAGSFFDSVWTIADAGTNDEADSDVDPETGLSPLFLLEDLTDASSWDVGFFPGVLTRIGGTVFGDADGDGVRSTADFPVEGVVVELYDVAGQFVAGRFTGADGRYVFEDLVQGDAYRVRFRSPHPRVRFIDPDEGTDDVVDSDADANGFTPLFILGTGPDATRWGAGFRTHAVAGSVWLDQDADGVRGPADPGLAGIRLELLGEEETVPAVVDTGPDGRFRFPSRLADRDFELSATHAGFVRTWTNRAGNDSGSDFPETGSVTVQLDIAAATTERDLGLVRGGTVIGDRVWLDGNADGVFAGGQGLEGVIVQALDTNGAVVRQETTDANGRYLLGGLTAHASYRLHVPRIPGFRFSPPDATADDQDSDVDPATGTSVPFPLDDVSDATKWDVGIWEAPPVAVGGVVWGDVDDDAMLGPGDERLGGWRVSLLSPEGLELRTTLTNASGEYAFAGLLEAGSYQLLFARPAAHLAFVEPDTGGNDEQDSDANPFDGRTPVFVAEPSVDRTRWSAGFRTVPAVGRVWSDLDGDGQQAPAEPGIAGIQLTLQGGGETQSTTTGPDGTFAFVPRTPFGTFRLGAVHPDHARTFVNRGDDGTDSDLPESGTLDIALAGPGSAPAWDLGLIPAGVAIGDRVWIDRNADGIQSPGDPGIADIGIELLGEDGAVQASTVSDDQGRYRFGGLKPGSSYALSFVPLPGIELTARDVGSNDLADSDADPGTGRTPYFTIAEVDDAVRWDAGFAAEIRKIGGRVWEDAGADGIQDLGEPGVPGVTVTLYQGTGSVIGMRTTTPDGRYVFDGLSEGQSYTIVFAHPADGVLSVQDAGGDDALDSDPDPRDGHVVVPALTTLADAEIWDAGVVFVPSRLGDRVWHDANGNGVQDPREPGVPGVPVSVFTSFGNFVASALTNDEGGYRFSALSAVVPFILRVAAPAGMKFTAQDAGEDDGIDSDVDMTGSTRPTYFDTPADARRWDAGLVHDCPYPEMPVRIVETHLAGDGTVRLDWTDPNPSATVTGFNVRTTEEPRRSIQHWERRATNLTEATWTDTELGPARGAIRYYLVAPFNADCDAEGPH